MSFHLEELFYSTGVFPHYFGYTYTIQAVRLAAADPKRIQNMDREIYQPIAIQNHTKVANVHKNIRTVRDIFWKNGGEQIFLEKTKCEVWKYQKPYPKEFIEVLAHLMREGEIL